MAAWRSSLDSGVNSVVADYRSHEVDGKVMIGVRVKVKVGFRD